MSGVSANDEEKTKGEWRKRKGKRRGREEKSLMHGGGECL